MDLEKSCAFTGHRQKSLPWGYNENDPACIRLKARLRDGVLDLITGSGVRHFISGMAQGGGYLRGRADYCTAGIGLPGYSGVRAALRRTGKPLDGGGTAALPQPALSMRYPDAASGKVYARLHAGAQPLYGCAQPLCPGGTGSTVRLAQRSDRTLIRINPV